MTDGDYRVQAIRCRGCGRLRPHPKTEGTLPCMCGARDFFPSFPMPGEEAWALVIYRKELEEADLLTPSLIAQTWNR
jgi:hypothetical protein